MKKNYSNGEITVHWDSSLCFHSENCVHGLPQVFRPSESPWIQIQNASSQDLMRVIDTCPSGALSYSRNEIQNETKMSEQINEPSGDANFTAKISLLKNGPLKVEGPVTITDSEGNIIETKQTFFLCRCGASKNKPFCDASHRSIGFAPER